MSRKSLKCNHARKLNGNLMPYVNQKWASRVLNMEINAGKGPDLLGTGKFAEVKFSLINPKENEKIGIEEATSFEDLYEMLKILGDIEGTGRSYTPDKIIEYIEQVRRDEMDIGYITRSHGIRSTVEKLLKNDKVYQEIVKRSAE